MVNIILDEDYNAKYERMSYEWGVEKGIKNLRIMFKNNVDIVFTAVKLCRYLKHFTACSIVIFAVDPLFQY